MELSSNALLHESALPLGASAQGTSENVLWYTHCPIPTATSIAWQHNALRSEFESDGIAINVLSQAPAREIRDSHYLHTQPNSFRHGGNLPPIYARSKGSDVRLLGMSWVGVRNAMLVRPNSDVRSIEDFAGRRLAVPRRPHAAFDFWRAHVLRTYESALASVGMSLDDVRLVDVEVSEDEGAEQVVGSVSLSDTARRLARRHRDEVIAMIKGEIDVIATEGQTAVTIEDVLGLKPVADLFELSDPGLRINNTMPTSLTVSGALLDERPDIVERWLEVVLRAADWARSNERETKRICALECGLHEDYVDRAFSPHLHHELDVSFGDESREALHSQHDFLLRHGFIDAPVDLEAFAAPELVSRVRARIGSA